MIENQIEEKTFFWDQRDGLILLLLAATILIVYWQARYHAFVAYDDVLYVTANRRVQAGLSLENIFWAFKSTSASNWHPLTWLSHMLDIQLYGMNPTGHHQTNVIFHILNTVLLYLVFRRMTGKFMQSGVVAALFALHPLHVESVAWVAQRKDVLSTFFWMLTLYTYARYVERPGIKRYGSVVIFFVLGLMAKPMLVTLPFVLLLLDFWPLKRFRATRLWDSAGSSAERRAFAKLIFEKTPLFALAAVSSIVTFMAQQTGGAVVSLGNLSLADRLINASVSYVNYVVKVIWPMRLSVFYPRPETIPAWQVAGSCLILAAIFWLAVWSLKRRPWIAVGWLWYVGTLIPVIGLVQVGLQAMADRYTYVPLIGLFLICAWGVAELFAKWPLKRIAGPLAASVFFAALMIMSWVQNGYWANSTVLYKHALNVTTDNYIAHGNLGATLYLNGEFSKATTHFIEALRIAPDYNDALTNLRVSLSNGGNFSIDQTIEKLDNLIKNDPEHPALYYTLGFMCRRKGELNKAIEQYQKALSYHAKYPQAQFDLAFAYSLKGEFKKALMSYKKAIKINPDLIWAYYNIAAMLADQNRVKESIVWLDLAVKKGFRNWDYLNGDKRMENIRKTSDYKKLISNRAAETAATS